MLFSIGTQTFEDFRDFGFTYVDKTAYVYKLAHEGKSYFLGRPRRFGKSLLVSTLEAYFQGRKELFEGLAIEKLEKEWKKHPVLLFSFSRKDFKEPGMLEKSLDEQLSLYEKIYGTDPIFTSPDGRLLSLIIRAYQQTGNKTVVLIDEYDKPMLDALDTPLEDVNRNIMRGFYSTFKDAEKYFRFLFFTGVTKFSQVSVFSGINQLNDISSNSAYDAICGITEEELYTVFAEPIEQFAKEEGCSVEEMKLRLKEQYDGYHFSKEMLDVYNPFSVMKALQDGDLGDFWFSTGTPSYLLRLLAHTDENIEDYVGKYYSAGLFKDYKANKEQPLPMIYQSGYLTIKGYNREDRSYLLDFPNAEVRRGFGLLLAAGYFKMNEIETDGRARQMIICLMNGRLENFINEVKSYLASIPYGLYDLNEGKITERNFQLTFFAIMQAIGGCRVTVEEASSRGRADFVVEFKNYVYIIEFKLDGSVEQALKQIDEKGYAEPYATDSRKVVKVGINFSSEKRNIAEWRQET